MIWAAAASASATETDHLILLFTLLPLLLVVPIFTVRYRDSARVVTACVENNDRMLEVGWMLIPFILTLIFFV